MKLLIIEDELELQSLIVRFLKNMGYLCETASTFQEGYKKLNNYDYDCVLVDLNLPGGDGLKLIKLLRTDGTKTGVIIISVRDSLEERINGLDLGADDYLVKPFNFSELNSRIKAVLRRNTKLFNNELIHGELIINQEARSVRVRGAELQLTKKEYDILLYLARNKNRVVTKDSIAEHLWGDYMDEAVSFDFIYAHVKNLRKKLTENGCGDFLKTVYGIGYKFQSN